MKGLFQSRDGTPIYYEVQGQGRPLLFCYGLLCRQDHWRHQIPYFASRYQLIHIDYRGHQRSGIPANEQTLTLEWCASDIQDLLRFLGINEVACLGHSLGVAVLCHLAILEPERLKAMVMICGSVNNPFSSMFFTDRLDPVFEGAAKLHDAVPDISQRVWHTLTAKSSVGYFLASQLGFNPQQAHEQDVWGYLQGVHETHPDVFYRLMQDYRRVDRTQLLNKVQTPALVIAGDMDCITPLEVQQQLCQRLPRGEFESIPEGSHNAHMDFPDLVNAAIARFLERIEYT